MSDILVADGFGNLTDGNHISGTSTEPIGQWSGWTDPFTVTDRGDGTKWINSTSGGNIALLSSAFAEQATLSICFRIYPTDRTTTSVAAFYDGSSIMGWIKINSSGQLEYITSNSQYLDTGGFLVANSTASLQLDTESHVEIKVTFNNSTGSVAFYINGALDSETTAIDTIYSGGASLCDNIYFFGALTSVPTAWKFTDAIVHKAASPIGDCKVLYLEADADGVDTDFTPSAGSNFECVDEIGPDGDTTYNESDGTAGHRDSFTNAGVLATYDIVSVGALVRARKTDSGTATIIPGVVHSGSETQGDPVALSESYSSIVEFVDDVPGGSNWTPTQVGDAEVSYEVGS